VFCKSRCHESNTKHCNNIQGDFENCADILTNGRTPK
jgi:hypothetical protein